MTSAPTKSDGPSNRAGAPVADPGFAQQGVWVIVGRTVVADPGHHRALRVAARLVLGSAALVDELLDEGVVLRDLAERAVPEHEGPRVPM